MLLIFEYSGGQVNEILSEIESNCVPAFLRVAALARSRCRKMPCRRRARDFRQNASHIRVPAFPSPPRARRRRRPRLYPSAFRRDFREGKRAQNRVRSGAIVRRGAKRFFQGSQSSNLLFKRLQSRFAILRSIFPFFEKIKERKRIASVREAIFETRSFPPRCTQARAARGVEKDSLYSGGV